jgi:hypothetical protein
VLKKDQEINMNISLPKIECLAHHYGEIDLLSDSYDKSQSSSTKSKDKNKVKVMKREK